MVSLRGLEAALDEVLKAGTGAVPDEVRFLAGIQRIEYVFVYPEDNDVVLAGPGEGWKVDEKANVVGVTTGRPVLRLDDLLVALRTVEQSRLGGITCSIDPTAEGICAYPRGDGPAAWKHGESDGARGGRQTGLRQSAGQVRGGPGYHPFRRAFCSPLITG